MRPDTLHPRYRALSLASAIFWILGYVAIVVGVIAIVAYLLSFRTITTQKWLIAGGIALATFVQAVLYWAISDIIDVITDMYRHIHRIQNVVERQAEPETEQPRTTEAEATAEKRAAG